MSLYPLGIAATHQALHEAWDPIFQRFTSELPPCVDALLERFGDYLKPSEVTVADFTADDVEWAWARSSSFAAGGTDEFRAHEFKLLGKNAAAVYADVLNGIDQVG